MLNLQRWPPPTVLRQVTLTALAATLAILLIFAVHDQPLRPYSIVALELAWTPGAAREMFTAWGPGGLQVARRSLLIDFIFMPAYALLFVSLMLGQARRASGRWQAAGILLAGAPFAAWAFDIIENVALLIGLTEPTTPSAEMFVMAGVAATIKFALLAICLAYLASTLIRHRVLTGAW